MSVIGSNILAGSSGQGGGAVYEIERSLRFNSADSPFLNRVFGTATSTTTFSISMWVKRVEFSQATYLFVAGTGTQGYFIFDADIIRFYGVNGDLKTNSKYRDPSAWYHIVGVADTSNATSDDRMRLYVNGVRLTNANGDFSTHTQPGQGASLGDWNSAATHYVNRLSSGNYQNFYLADFHFIDGQALAATDFGKYDTNNVWQPKEFTGTYGTNGFHLDFSDNSSDAALGTDASSNGNTWTVNNLSVAAGAGNDALRDSPVNGDSANDTGAGGEITGNYATWNPVDDSGGVTLSDGNLKATSTTSGTGAFSTISMTSGKWFWEQTIQGANTFVGIADQAALATARGYSSSNGLYYYGSTGTTYGTLAGFSAGTSVGATFGAGDVIGTALDMDNGTVAFYTNGTLQNTLTLTGLSNYKIVAAMDNGGGAATVNVLNAGQRPFAYTAPSGYKALCTANLINTTVITSGTYTGNSAASGPFVYLNGVPTAMSIGGSAVTFGTDIDKLSNGFKIRSATSNNTAATSYSYSVTTTGDPFKTARAQTN